MRAKFIFEAEIYDESILPLEAQKKLGEWYADKNDIIRVVPDPKVPGSFAVEVEGPKGEKMHLIWHHDGFDEVEFDTFPPESGDLKWFLV